MNSIQIKCFLALAQTGSYAKAEDLLYLSSRSVRKYVSALEEEMGLNLFKSQNNFLALTDVGEMFFRFFSVAKTDYQVALTNALGQQSHNIPISISILDGLESIDGILDPLFTAETINSFSFNISYRSFNNILTSLTNGDINLAVMLNFPRFIDQLKIKGLQTSLLHRDTLELYYSDNANIISHNTVQPQIDDFQNSTFFMSPFFSPTKNEIPQKLKIATWVDDISFVPHTEIIDSLNTIIFRVSNGEGVTVAPSRSRLKREPFIKSIPIDHEIEIILVWLRQNETSALHELIKVSTENF